jgi:alkylation response protein AidB-like acyl-CoA dehydrogenase
MLMASVLSDYRESDEQREFRASINGMLERLWSETVLRAALDEGPADIEKAKLAVHQSLGIAGLLVPEEFGGLGATRIDAVIASEELGAGLAPYDLFGSCMSAQVLLGVADPGREVWLRRLASDDRPFVLVWPGADASWGVDAIEVAEVSGGKVTASVGFVPGLQAGAVLLVPARSGGVLGVAVVDGAAVGSAVSLTMVESADALRPVGTVALVDAECVFLAVPDAAGVFTSALALGAVLMAAEMCGASRSCIERAVEYGNSRRQFGHPIITFQALKHRIVDALIQLEMARASTYRAATKADVGAGDPGSVDEVIMLARMSKSAASEALHKSARESIQIHGGMGFTWENLSHRYLKKWVTSNNIYGPADQQRGLVYQFTQYNTWNTPQNQTA